MRLERVLGAEVHVAPARDGTRRPRASPGRTVPAARGSTWYSVVSPVSPLKKTACRRGADHQRRPQRGVAALRVRPEKCCEGAAVTVRRRRPACAIPTSRARGCAAVRCPRPPGARRRRARSRTAPRSAQLADGRVVEVIVVVVRYDDEIQRRQRRRRHRHGLEALRAGEPRGRGARTPYRVGEHAQRRRFR